VSSVRITHLKKGKRELFAEFVNVELARAVAEHLKGYEAKRIEARREQHKADLKTAEARRERLKDRHEANQRAALAVGAEPPAPLLDSELPVSPSPPAESELEPRTVFLPQEFCRAFELIGPELLIGTTALALEANGWAVGVMVELAE
jgi:hypothetical protein